MLFVLGAVTVVIEWKSIRTSGEITMEDMVLIRLRTTKVLSIRKPGWICTFPLFMFTYVPIAIAAFRKNVTWSPIAHTGYQINHP